MADLDTAEKRRSGAGWLRGVFGGYGPEPDTDLDNRADRVEMAFEYRGLEPREPSNNYGLLLGIYRNES